MRILVLAHFYLPGYKAGGPIRTLSNLIENLGNEHSFLVITSDRDYSDAVAYPGIARSTWTDRGLGRVYYLRPGFHKLLDVPNVLKSTPYDLLYLNSLFDPIFTLLPLLLRRLHFFTRHPVILAPRGELSAGALSLKPKRKQIFLWLAKRFGLYRGLIWQASSHYEANDIREWIGSATTIHVAANVPSLSVPDKARPTVSDSQEMPLTVIFLSRLAPKKNLDFALQVLQRVKVSVDFSIYGPTEDKIYVDLCHRLAAQLPNHIRVFWRGEIRPEQVPDTLAAHDLFFFPTRGENYGHVIAESLSAGTPVLLSDTTPWRDLTEAGVGWDLPLDNTSAFAACIDAFAKLSPDERARCRQRAQHYVHERLNMDSILAANRRLFWSAIDAAPHAQAGI